MKKQLPIFNHNSWQLKKLPKAIHRISHNRKSLAQTAARPPAGRAGIAPGRAKIVNPWPRPQSRSHQGGLKSQSGFTLMELLVVIGIIIVIAASIVTVIPGMRQKTQENATKAFMERLEIAIERYYADNRIYPLTTIKELKEVLQPPSEDRSKQYIEFDDSEVNGDDIVDYWGNPFVYVSSTDATPNNNTTTYDLYSKGVDGATSSSPNDGDDADDINNWSR